MQININKKLINFGSLQIIYTQEAYNKPLFATYFKTSLFSIYLTAFIFWRPWQRLCVRGWRIRDNGERQRVSGNSYHTSTHTPPTHHTPHTHTHHPHSFFLPMLPVLILSMKTMLNPPLIIQSTSLAQLPGKSVPTREMTPTHTLTQLPGKSVPTRVMTPTLQAALKPHTMNHQPSPPIP